MAASLRRGFKAEAERQSQAIRTQLNLGPMGRLSCFVLADHLCVPVASLQDLLDDGASPESVARLARSTSPFSAVTICCGEKYLVVYNHSHPPARQANSVVHELVHVLLKHPPLPALGAGGCRVWEQRYEEEADWLAGAILVPREGAVMWFRRGGQMEDGADHFGVSLELFRWRVNQTGVARQLARSRA